MITISGPTELKVLDPTDQNGRPLDDTNATATLTLLDQLAETTLVGPIAMTWSTEAVPTPTWIYDLDPSSFAPGVYVLNIVLTPTAGLPVPLQDEIDYSPGIDAPTSPQPVGVKPQSQHFLNPYCSIGDLPSGGLTDSNGNEITDVPLSLVIAAATELLFKRTRRKYRSGRSVVRPSMLQNAYAGQSFLYPYSSMSGYGSPWGFGNGWAWPNVGTGWWQSSQDLAEVVLQAPVLRINSVMVDGVILPPTAYTLYDRRRLVRNLDDAAPGSWPWNQQLRLPLTQPGTWQIDYTWGRPVTPLGKLAAIELSQAFLSEISRQDSSGLAARVTRVATQGFDEGVGDALDFLKAGYTGLPIVDAFIDTENPTHSRKRSTFMSPSTVLNRST